MNDKAYDPTNIPVYPKFGVCYRSYNMVDNPHVCEDDKGRLAFLSERDKEEFLREYSASRRCG